MSVARKMINLFRGEQLHRDAADELAYHLEARTKEYMARGMSEEDAQLAARRRLGNPTSAAEETVSADAVAWLNACRRDVVLAFRVLRKAPLFAVMAVLSLALGIGANTMVFTVLKHVVLDALPVPHPEQLVILHNPGPLNGHVSENGMESAFSYPLYRDLNRASGAIFDGILARYGVTVTLVENAVTTRVNCELSSGNYFNVLSVRPWRGRLLAPSDDQKPNGHPVAVLSYGFWQRRFGGDQSIIGKTVRLNTFPYQVIGIAPPHFSGIGSDNPDLFVPIMMKAQMMPTEDALLERSNHWANLLARLRPGITATRATSELSVLYPPLHDQDLATIRQHDPTFLAEFKKARLHLSPGGKGYNSLRETLRSPLTFLSVMVGIVLLITVVNVANLLIARAAAREREMAIRLSVGAGRTAVLRQLLIESLLLASIGGGIGIAFAYLATPALLRLLQTDLSESSISAHPDGPVLFATALVSLGAGLAFGLLPALQSARTSVTVALRTSGGTGHTGGRLWLRRLLVSAQIGFSLLLLTAALLFTVSLWNSQHVNTGLATDYVYSFKVDPLQAGYSQSRIQAFGEDMRKKLEQLPSVVDAGLATVPILENDENGRGVTVPGYVPHNEDNDVLINGVGPHFFETFQIPLRLGRLVNQQDMRPDANVVVINATFASHFFKGRNPVGAHLQFGGGFPNKSPVLTVVGVVADSRHADLRGPIKPFVYLPYTSIPNLGQLTFYIRTQSDDEGVLTLARSAVSKIDPSLALFDVRSIKLLITEDLFAERGLALLSVVFAGLATLLALVGLYGVIAYSVARRRREFGIRMAIGADRWSVLRMVLQETALLGIVSLVCALPLVYAAGHLISSALYGVKPTDPWICSGAATLLFVAALCAGLIPAASAARTDPYIALRTD